MRLRKRQRLMALGLGLAGLATATVLVLNAFDDSLVFFHAPTDVMTSPPPPERRFRLGGLVEEGSVARQADGVTVEFRVTDTVTSLPVRFTGVLPDLFREGQGVVAEGTLVAGVFMARDVLARHDENYMPKEVADALKAAGQFKPEPPAQPRTRP
jgi:cytochrome c-type biogenesis protein CcmE